MAKLLLINPLFTGCAPIYPLGIAHVAAACRDAADTRYIDMNLSEQPFTEAARALADFKPDFVGIGLRNLETTDDYCSYLPAFWSLVSLIREAVPESKVIVGGGGFCVMPKAIMESHAGIDFGISGLGEAIVDLLSEGGVQDVSGIWVREGETVHEPRDTQDTKKRDFHWYPYELLDEIICVDKYWQVNPEYGIGIQTKRGCERACSYCIYPELEGRRYHSRTVEEVLADVSFLYKKGVTRFFVSDSVANDLPDKFRQLCDGIKEMSVPVTWGGWFREDQIDSESARLAYEAGCDWFSFSPDGGCQFGLDLLKKDLTIEQVKEAGRICAELPVRVMFHFFVNLPNETKQTVCETYQNIRQLHQIFVARPEFVGATCKNVRVYPGTDFYNLVSDELPEQLLLPFFYNPSPYNNLRDIFQAVCSMLLAQVKQNNSDFSDIDKYFLSLIEENQ